MNAKTPSSLLVGVLALFLSGCAIATASLTSKPGWSNTGNAAPSQSPIAGENGLCVVKAPNIRPTTDRAASLSRLERRPVVDENAIEEGFTMKEAICDDAVTPDLMQAVASRLRERGYAVAFGSSSFDEVVAHAFEQYKRDNGFYGDGLTLDALTHLGVDALSMTTDTESGHVADGWARASR